MVIADFVGSWHAIGSTSIRGEIPFVDDEPDPNGVHDWLNGDGVSLAKDMNPVDGLILSIGSSGVFSEQKVGNPQVYWFDSEGVLTPQVEPFDGSLKVSAGVTYLLPTDVPRWSKHLDGRYGDAVLRLDDGDTKICDRVDPVEGQLVRTINVVTDELYLDRVVIIYRRSLGVD
jgi:hypothetical protein